MNHEADVKILIAEDEPIILNNIAKKAQKAGEWIRICGRAESGGHALSLLEQEPADILITDIEMPGMNGLELIRQVREKYPAMRVVILSGYSNFEYARMALRYGVKDYLLKPLVQEAFTELLEKLRKEISAEKASLKREIISMAFNSPQNTQELPSSLTDGSFYLLFLTIGNYSGTSMSVEISPEYLRLWEQLHPDELLKHLPGLEHVWMIDETYGLSKFYILHTEAGRLSAGYLKTSINNYLKEHLPETPYLLLLHPRSIRYRDIWNTAKEMRQYTALYACPFKQDAFFTDSLPEKRLLSLREYSQLVNVLHSLTSASSFLQYSEKNMRELFTRECTAQTLLKFTGEIFEAAETVLLADNSLCRKALNEISADFYHCPGTEDFLFSFTEKLNSLLKRQGTAAPGENLCTRITQYIRSNYCTRLSLNDLSEYFGYTSSYINRIFKKELGISPLQYITNLKLQKAKELLSSQPTMDIREIAAAIGYEDARYFSRVFKNETGVPPSSWNMER